MTESHLIYLTAVILAIIIEHRVFSKKWKNYELARWTMGVATVMAFALPLALTGHLDWNTWLYIMAAFCAAGAITAALYINEQATADHKRANDLRNAINERQKD